MLSVSVKYKRNLLRILFLYCSPVLLFSNVLLGVGAGIQSYPKDLDPDELNRRFPVIYPQGELGFSLSERFAIICAFSRIDIPGGLDRNNDFPQELELYSGSIGCEFDLGKKTGFFGAGIQGQSIIGIYKTNNAGEYDNGYGVNIYGIVRHSVYNPLTVGVRTSIQRVWVQIHTSGQDTELILDSFHIIFIVYIDV